MKGRKIGKQTFPNLALFVKFQDMAIIETLWKEDVATGGILNGGEPSGPQVGVTLSAGGATSSNDTDPDPSSSLTEQTFEDPHSVQLDHSINTAACGTHLTEFNVSLVFFSTGKVYS